MSGSLNLENGITSVEYEIDGNKIIREAFISSKYNAIFYHYKSLNKLPVNCSIRYTRKKDARQYIDENNVLIESWFMPAYGKTPDSMMLSRSNAITTAATVALRDAGAKLLLDFYRIPSVYSWMERQQDAMTP